MGYIPLWRVKQIESFRESKSEYDGLPYEILNEMFYWEITQHAYEKIEEEIKDNG